MGKSILLSIKPKYVAMILNKTKTIEIRKCFPANYVGWVYIYCTKLKPYGYGCMYDELSKKYETTFCDSGKELPNLTGKVVARFWCDKVQILKHFTETERIKDEEEYYFDYWADKPLPLSDMSIQPKSCVSNKELRAYAKGKKELLAISITNLEIFDKPKELNEFYKVGVHKDLNDYFTDEKRINGKWCIPLTKAPQNLLYIEIE